MNSTELKKLAAILPQIADGAEWQWKDAAEMWHNPASNISVLYCADKTCGIRLKPEPEYAPLEPSDFPPGAAIRHPAWDKGEWYLPHTCGPNAQQWRRDNMPTLFMPPMDGRTLMNEGWLYLLPGQSDWQPCRKIAPEKP